MLKGRSSLRPDALLSYPPLPITTACSLISLSGEGLGGEGSLSTSRHNNIPEAKPNPTITFSSQLNYLCTQMLGDYFFKSSIEKEEEEEGAWASHYVL